MMRISGGGVGRWLAAVLLASGGLSWAFSTGPAELVTGAPGEGTCADPTCHTSFGVNSGPGTFNLVTPAQYTPGDTLELSVQLQHTGQRRWGFQLTVINSLGDPVGTVLVTDPVRTWIEPGAGGRQYLMHTAPGSDSGTADVSPGWNFRWKAPASGAGNVTFYAAGNAADGDATSLGDYVYTTSVVMSEGSASVSDPMGAVPTGWHLGPIYPNPFNAGTRIRFEVDKTAAGLASLIIHDVNGRRVRTLSSNRYYGQGEHEIQWDGGDDLGATAPSGTYFVRLITRAGSDTRKVTLLR